VRFLLCIILGIAPLLRGIFFEDYYIPFLAIIPLLFLFFLYKQIKNRDSKLFDHPLDYAILGMLLAYVISLFTAVNTRSSLIALMKTAAYIMIYWMCFQAVLMNKTYKSLYVTFFISGISMAFIGLLIYCGALNYPFLKAGDRIGSTIEYANTLGVYMGVAYLLGLGLILSCRQSIVQAIIAGGNTLLLMSMLGSLSRGAWLLFPLMTLVYYLLDKGNRRNTLLILLITILPGLVMGRLFLAQSSKSGAILYMVLGVITTIILYYGINYIKTLILEKPGLPAQLASKKAKTIIAILFVLVFGAMLFIGAKTSFSQSSIARLTQITMQDENVQSRMEYNQDAIKIIKDHPITGVGAGGWEALYHQYASHLYWSSTAHNFILQTWLEGGILGILSLVALLLVLFHMLWKTFVKFRNDESKNEQAVAFWSGTTAFLLLASHSFIDWDMSYPSVAFLFFGLLGILKALATETSDSAIQAKPSKKSRQRSLTISWKKATITLFVISIVVAVCISLFSISLWAGGISYRSAIKIMNQNPNKALVLLNRSLTLDPLNARYSIQTASFWQAIAISKQDQNAYNKTLLYSEKAVNLEPYNIQILNNANLMYVKLGDYGKSLQLAPAIIKANPWDPSSYENLANSHLFYGLQLLEQGQLENAKSQWEECLQVINKVPAQIDSPALGLYCFSGQAYYLLGNKNDGEQQLRAMLNASVKSGTGQQRVEQISDLRNRARIWLAAYYKNIGNTAESEKLLNQTRLPRDANLDNQMKQIENWLKKIYL